MSVIYDDGAKQARLTATRDQVAGGTLEIGTAAMNSVLATFTLSSVGGSVVGPIWTLAFASQAATAAAQGTAVAAQIKRPNGLVAISGLTVGVSSSDIIVASNLITLGEPVAISTATVTHA